MKKPILERYSRTADGTPILDVAATQISDLYNHFDRTAPHMRKDLDQNLVDYLLDCARELDPYAFIIRITLQDEPTDEMISRVRGSIRNFFSYLSALEKRNMLGMLRKSLILLTLGLGLLAAAVLVNNRLGPDPAVFARVSAEGLTVAAWVSLWESLATFLVQWAPHRRELRLFKTLSETPVIIVRQDPVPD